MSDSTNKNNFEHQDWKPCVLRKSVKKTPPKQIDPIAKKMAKLYQTDDVPQIKKVSDSDRKMITSLRTERKITQEELARRLNLDKKVINQIESGQHLENKQLTSKIKNYLNKLPIPPPEED